MLTLSKIHVVEEHHEALAIWQRAGAIGQTLIHVDAHLDFNWWGEGEVLHCGNFLYQAIRSGIVSHLAWVVPDSFWNVAASYEEMKRELSMLVKEGTIEEAEGVLRFKLLACTVEVSTLARLAVKTGPVLLDIDIDYFTTLEPHGRPIYFENDAPAPWIIPADWFPLWQTKNISVEGVTIACSVNDGYTPLRYKYFAKDLALALSGEGRPLSTPAPESAAAWYEQMLSAFSAKEWDAAKNAWQQTIQKDPSYRTPLAFQGWRLHKSERWDEALAQYDLQIHCDPEWSAGHLGRAQVLEALGRISEAQSAFRKAADLGSATASQWLKTQDDILGKTWSRSPSIVTRQVVGETILVPTTRHLRGDAALFTLDDIASFLWERIDGERNGFDLAGQLALAYEVGETQAQNDVRLFLQQLQIAGAIEAATVHA